MMTLLQPSVGAGLIEFSNANPVAKLQERQMMARHAAVMPSGTGVQDGASVSLDSLVQSALEAGPTYGLDSSLTASDVANAYSRANEL